MIMALRLSAAAHGSGLTAAALPTWLVAGMQVVIGCITGARLAGTSLSEARTALWQGIVWATILVGMSAGAASLSVEVMHQPWPALFLAMTPGGFAEMSIIALAAGIEVAFVVTCHAFRTICIVLVAPFLYQLSLRRMT
jgi:membrane AbrB-like protein